MPFAIAFTRQSDPLAPRDFTGYYVADDQPPAPTADAATPYATRAAADFDCDIVNNTWHLDDDHWLAVVIATGSDAEAIDFPGPT